MRTVRWGMIGCGDVAEVKSGPGFRLARGSALVAVMRRDGAAAADYARRHGVPRSYDDAARLIADPEVDAVYVATPPSSHRAYALQAAAAGKPVYVEKPMAMDEAEARAMVDACAAARVPLFVAYYRRALPRFLAVKRLLDERAIGRVRLVRVVHDQPPGPAEAAGGGALPWRVRPEVSGGGLFVDVGCHTLDLLDFLLGPISDVSGDARNAGGLYEAEDTVTARFRLGDEIQAVGAWCFVAPRREERVQILGARGEISFSVFAEAPVRLLRDGIEEAQEIPHPPHVQQPLIQTIVDELRGEDAGRARCPSTGQSALRATWAVDRVLARHRAGRPPDGSG
jgi:predicted dehydrogenase